MPDGTLAECGTDVGALLVEIQIHTASQSLWATTSHELIYKPLVDVPDPIKRTMHRLGALAELFDLEAERVKTHISNDPALFEFTMLEELEKHYYTLTAESYNRPLSMSTLEILKLAYTDDERLVFASIISDFVQNNHDHLAQIYRDYAPGVDDTVWLIHQPEAIVVFERLVAKKFVLKDTWSKLASLTILSPLATAWGTSLR